MLFDTHCHLNFKAFDGRVNEVIEKARKVGVTHIVIPGTDVETSNKAVEIAEKFDNVYAAVGIHPHHVYEKFKDQRSKIKVEIQEIEKLLENKKVVAVGEVGVDRHIYRKTVYQAYQVDQELIELQKEYLKAQIDLALKYDKSIIFHNREAKTDFLGVIGKPAVAKALAGKAVFHCCEPDEELLEFAKNHKMFIGVDGDVTYRKDKQEFIKKVPLEILVLETDSPFLLPEPLKSQKKYPRLQRQKAGLRGGQANEPKNLKLIAEFIAHLTNVSINQLIDTTTNNAKDLLGLY